jgi:hypothetical protein
MGVVSYWDTDDIGENIHLGKRMQALQARTSNAISDAATDENDQAFTNNDRGVTHCHSG